MKTLSGEGKKYGVRELRRGNVVHCDLTGGLQRVLLGLPLPPPWRILRLAGLLPSPSHSGICISEKEIVAVDFEGRAVVQTPKEFLFGFARRIYVACINGKSLSFPSAADSAEKRLAEGTHTTFYETTATNFHVCVCGEILWENIRCRMVRSRDFHYLTLVGRNFCWLTLLRQCRVKGMFLVESNGAFCSRE